MRNDWALPYQPKIPWFKKLEEDEDADDSSTLKLKIHQLSSSNLFINPKINGSSYYVQVDCGSQISTIPMQILSAEQRKMIRPSDLVLSAYGGSRVHHLGTIDLSLELGNGMIIPDCEFVVVKAESVPLLGNNILLSKDGRLEIDTIKNEIELHGTKVKLYYSEGGATAKMNSVCVKTSDSSQKMIVMEHTELKPRSETMVRVKLLLPPSTTNMITEPQAAFRFSNGRRFRLPIGKGLYSAHQFNEFVVRVANPYGQSVNLELGSKLGSIQPVNGELVKPTMVNSVTTDPVPENRVDQILAEMDIGEISKKQKGQLRSIIMKYQKTILLRNELPGVADVEAFRVYPKDDAPVSSQSYRTPYPLRPVMKEILKKQMEKGLIERSHSPWNSPTLLVQKPSGDYRLVIDYRKVNAAIKGDSYPLPRIPDLLVNLKGSKIFSALDLCSGYHQIPLAEDSREPLVMGNELGQFSWRVMPQGVKNAPSFFQRIMDQVFEDVPMSAMVIYLDDILVHSKDIQTNLTQLDQCFKLLADKNLQVKAEKAKLLHPEIQFCGHKIKDGRIHIPEKGVKAVLNIPKPRSKVEAQQCFGLVNYLRKSIPDFARIARPITRTFGAGRFIWTPEADNALQKLKQLIADATEGLQIPDVNTDIFVVESDASDTSMGACLYVCSKKCPPGAAPDWHEHDEDCLKPVEFFSHNFTASQAEKWFIRDKELMSFKCASQKWRMYLLGRPFVWRTDNSCLSYANEAKKTNPKVAKILAEVGEFDYVIQRRSTRQMAVSDALSRSIRSLKITIEDFGILQKSDPLLKKIIGFVTIGKWPKQVSDPEVLFWKKKSSFLKFGTKGELLEETKNGCKLLVPAGHRDCLIESYHDHSGHPGLKNTFIPMSNHFTWYQMRQTIEDYVKTCEECQKNKPNLHVKKPPMAKTDTPRQLFEKISVDLTGPLPRTNRNNRWIVVANDHFSKRIHTRAITDKSASKVLTAVKSMIFQEMGRVPRNILTDNGLEFAGVFADWLKEQGIKHSHSAPYAPTTNGLTERCNQSLKNRLKPKKNPSNWDDLLLPITMQLNLAPNEVTKRSPIEIEFGLQGINPAVPVDIVAKNLEDVLGMREEVRRFIEDEKKTRSSKFDRFFVPFKLGDSVLMKTPAASKDRYMGPYIVVNVFADGRSYEICDDNGVSYKRQCKDLKPYHDRGEKLEAPEAPEAFVELESQIPLESPQVLYPNAGLGWLTVSLPRYSESRGQSNVDITVTNDDWVAEEDVPIAAEVIAEEESVVADEEEASSSFYLFDFGEGIENIFGEGEAVVGSGDLGDGAVVSTGGAAVEENVNEEELAGSSLSEIVADANEDQINNTGRTTTTTPTEPVVPDMGDDSNDSMDSEYVMVQAYNALESEAAVGDEPLNSSDVTMNEEMEMDNTRDNVQSVPDQLMRSQSVPMELSTIVDKPVAVEKKRRRSASGSPGGNKRCRPAAVPVDIAQKDDCSNSFLEYTYYELSRQGLIDHMRSMEGYSKEASIPITLVPGSYHLPDQNYFQLIDLALKWGVKLKHYDLNTKVTLRRRITSYAQNNDDIESTVINGKKYYTYNGP